MFSSYFLSHEREEVEEGLHGRRQKNNFSVVSPSLVLVEYLLLSPSRKDKKINLYKLNRVIDFC